MFPEVLAMLSALPDLTFPRDVALLDGGRGFDPAELLVLADCEDIDSPSFTRVLFAPVEEAAEAEEESPGIACCGADMTCCSCESVTLIPNSTLLLNTPGAGSPADKPLEGLGWRRTGGSPGTAPAVMEAEVTAAAAEVAAVFDSRYME